jgi:hypothetical protein
MNTLKARQLTLDRGAERLRYELSEEVEAMFLSGGSLSDMKEWGSKLVGQIIRVAGLLHIAEYVQAPSPDNPMINQIPKQINKTTFAKARQFTTYFINHAKAAYGCMGVDGRTEDAKYLLAVVKRQKKPIIEYRDIQILTNKRFKNASRLKSTFHELEERGFVFKRKEGRKTIYEVNPYILDVKENPHITYNAPHIPSEKEEERRIDKPTHSYNTYNFETESTLQSENNRNVGDVGKRRTERLTQHTPDSQRVQTNEGNVGKHPDLVIDDDDEVI